MERLRPKLEGLAVTPKKEALFQLPVAGSPQSETLLVGFVSNHRCGRIQNGVAMYWKGPDGRPKPGWVVSRAAFRRMAKEFLAQDSVNA